MEPADKKDSDKQDNQVIAGIRKALAAKAGAEIDGDEAPESFQTSPLTREVFLPPEVLKAETGAVPTPIDGPDATPQNPSYSQSQPTADGTADDGSYPPPPPASSSDRQANLSDQNSDLDNASSNPVIIDDLEDDSIDIITNSDVSADRAEDSSSQVAAERKPRRFEATIPPRGTQAKIARTISGEVLPPIPLQSQPVSPEDVPPPPAPPTAPKAEADLPLAPATDANDEKGETTASETDRPLAPSASADSSIAAEQESEDAQTGNKSEDANLTLEDTVAETEVDLGSNSDTQEASDDQAVAAAENLATQSDEVDEASMVENDDEKPSTSSEVELADDGSEEPSDSADIPVEAELSESGMTVEKWEELFPEVPNPEAHLSENQDEETFATETEVANEGRAGNTPDSHDEPIQEPGKKLTPEHAVTPDESGKPEGASGTEVEQLTDDTKSAAGITGKAENVAAGAIAGAGAVAGVAGTKLAGAWKSLKATTATTWDQAVTTSKSAAKTIKGSLAGPMDPEKENAVGKNDEEVVEVDDTETSSSTREKLKRYSISLAEISGREQSSPEVLAEMEATHEAEQDVTSAETPASEQPEASQAPKAPRQVTGTATGAHATVATNNHGAYSHADEAIASGAAVDVNAQLADGNNADPEVKRFRQIMFIALGIFLFLGAIFAIRSLVSPIQQFAQMETEADGPIVIVKESTEPTAEAPGDAAPKPAEPAPGPAPTGVAIEKIEQFSPDGYGKDHPEEVGNLLDGKDDTTWHSRYFPKATFRNGAISLGVFFKQPAKVKTVKLYTNGTGGRIDLVIPPGGPAQAYVGDPAVSAPFGPEVTLTLPEAVDTSVVTLRIPELPKDPEGRNRAYISRIVVE
ncbi:hypothetical protein BK816_08940 [Boudabousia tangfeifanii]|uniref:Uncharacterized protein n=1 Tax=Boudabousia tangfeifanii TaxID=1912795 RepID=A0A1D9MLY3_9ACTO|nr:hypothetical protein [Boudabousia tangfeifanii]AOZ73381.1 hypothetical protein BK816_08940 [Boudabousia tangfeifanii]